MAKSFREQFADDCKHVLLNVDEFGRICKWNGQDLQIAEGVLDDSDLAEGVYSIMTVVYCREQDLENPPRVTEAVNFDGRIWYVLNVKRPLGYFIISLGRNAS